jgi:hypothetical protein
MFGEEEVDEDEVMTLKQKNALRIKQNPHLKNLGWF